MPTTITHPLSKPPTINPISHLPIKPHHPRTSTVTYAKTTTTSTSTSTNKSFLRSQRSRKTLIHVIRFAASNLHYVLPLPPPLNSVIQQFTSGGPGSGSGGSGGAWNNFRWGGFDGGGGRRRRGSKKSYLWLLGCVLICCLAFWWMDLGVQLELRNDGVLLGGVGLLMFMVLVRNGFVPEWVLGFCGGGVVVGVLCDKKDGLRKFVRGVKALGVSRRQRRRRFI